MAQEKHFPGLKGTNYVGRIFYFCGYLFSEILMNFGLKIALLDSGTRAQINRRDISFLPTFLLSVLHTLLLIFSIAFFFLPLFSDLLFLLLLKHTN